MKVAVHDGMFHADEIFAAAVIFSAHRGGMEVVRSRNPKDWDACDMVVDVGGEYDGERYFDHHQDSCPLREDGNKYAACGLVWKHHGHQAIQRTLDRQGLGISDEIRDTIWQLMDDEVISAVDRIDNGQAREGEEKRFGFVSVQNTCWFEDDAQEVEAFDYAMAVAQVFLTRQILKFAGEVLARDKVAQAIADAEEGVMILDNFVPWKREVFKWNEENPDNLVVLCVHPGKGSPAWVVTTVAPSYEEWNKQLVPFPEAWAGKRDNELQELTNLRSAVFVHKGRFIGGCEDREDAVKMAHDIPRHISLEIETPHDEAVVETESFVVSGQAPPGAVVVINVRKHVRQELSDEHLGDLLDVEPDSMGKWAVALSRTSGTYVVSATATVLDVTQRKSVWVTVEDPA